MVMIMLDLILITFIAIFKNDITLLYTQDLEVRNLVASVIPLLLIYMIFDHGQGVL